MKTKLVFGGIVALTCLNLLNAQNTSVVSNPLPVPGTGVNNVLVGLNNLTSNTTGWGNSSVGYGALQNNTTGYANSANGSWALQFNTSGYGNTASGSGALNGNTSGFGNTAYGAGSVRFTTNGTGNTGVGADALIGNTTGNNNTALGASADVMFGNFTNATAIGSGAIVQGSNLIQLGDPTVVQIQCWSGNYGSTSDGRFKYNISESDVKGLDFINSLRPVVYNMDTKKLTEFITRNMPDSTRRKHLQKDFTNSSLIRQSGFIAQEVEMAAKKTGYNFNGVRVPSNDNETYSLAYGQFVVPLAKGMQEQQKMIEGLKQEIENLKNALASKDNGKTGIPVLNTPDNFFKLDQNEPNPFTNETLIGYTLDQKISNAYLAVYDLAGKQITSFPLNQRGSSSITISSENIAAGIYIYSVIADGKIMDSKRMVVSQK